MTMRRMTQNRTLLLAAATVICALVAVASAPWALNLPTLNFVFKPLTTALVIAYAWPRGRDQPAQRRWVLVGLSLSWIGDVALLWPQQGFLPGLVSFLLAHLAYLVAFTREQRLAVRVLPFVVYALVAAAVLWHLWPGVPPALRLPVLAYVLCLSAMAAQTGALALAGDARGRVLARVLDRKPVLVLAVGGALFMVSDALLAMNKFAGPLPLANLWILSTYWAAQWCIASWLRPATTAESPPAR